MTKASSQADQRTARLAEQLRANLRKRKSQVREVSAQVGDKPASD